MPRDLNPEHATLIFQPATAHKIGIYSSEERYSRFSCSGSSITTSVERAMIIRST
jgi:hypothetical protein